MLKRSLTALALLLVGMPTVIFGGPLFFVLIERYFGKKRGPVAAAAPAVNPSGTRRHE